MTVQSPQRWVEAQRVLEVLASLSYQAGELKPYLTEIAYGVSQLLELDWSVVTLCWNGTERVMASSIDMGDGEQIYSLHGLLTDTVVRTGQSLAVEDAKTHPEYGKPPEGYTSYLGVPLRTPQGKTIGTICSFCCQPRQFIMEEVRVVELFAERAATAIDNYNLYQKLLGFNETLEAEVAKRTEELQVAQVQLIERERLAAIGEFAAMIVHEIRNPVTTMTMGLEYFKRSHPSERDQVRATLALEEAHRLHNLLSEILLYAKPHVLQLTELDLNEFIQDLLPFLQEMPEARERTIEFRPAQPARILGDKDKLKQVFINVVRNACEAIAAGEMVTWSMAPDESANQVCIQIHNGGTPIPADMLPQLTQPFCSTKPGGTGLGLAIVKRIVEAHKGALLIQSDAITGTTIRIHLPLLSSRPNSLNCVISDPDE